jgi:hypothetical protein
MNQRIALTTIILLLMFHPAKPQKYSDGRPVAVLRMDAKDAGVVLRYGDGPDSCDIMGARDVWIYWSKDLNRWNPQHKAIVIDRQNCKLSRRCI